MHSPLRLGLLASMAMVLAGSVTLARTQEPDKNKADTLNGRYGVSMYQSCIQTPRGQPPATGFDPTTGALVQKGEILGAVLKGTLLFDRQGNVSVPDALLSDLFFDKTNVGDVPISAKTPVSCQGSYSRADESLNLTLDCVAQLPPNLTVTIGTFKIEGLVGTQGRAITISSVEGNVLKESVAVGGHTVAERERVCLLQGALNKLPAEDNE